MTLFRAAVVTAIFASMMLVLDYQNPMQPTFCGARSGCAEVASSELGKVIAGFLHDYGAGTTLPQLGLFAFLLLLVGSFTLRPTSATGSLGPDGRTYSQPSFIRGRVMALAIASGIGGVVAAVLIVAQATIHAFCLYCMIVDTSMMFAAACAIILYVVGSDEERTKRALAASTSVPVIAAWSILATGALGLPFLWTLYPVTPPLPKEIQALEEPGKVTIVSLTDFECPHCRKFHPYLTAARQKPDIAFKRLMVPLPFHRNGLFAARTYLCVPEDRRDETAERLYEMPPEDMAGDGLTALAEEMGVPKEDFLTCADSEATTARIQADVGIFEAIKGRGLPLTYVGRYAIEGSDVKRLQATVANANAAPPELPTWALFALSGLLIAAVTGFAWRRADDNLSDVLSPRGRA